MPAPRPTTVASAVALLIASSQAMAAEWYFFVENNSSSAITRLETRETGGSWGYFELDGGIRPGTKVRLEWAKSTNNQDCEQDIRATFADGSRSQPVAFDFCNDLDTPITFED